MFAKAEKLVEFMRCLDTACAQSYRLPLALHQRITPALPNPPTAVALVAVACFACSLLQPYCAPDFLEPIADDADHAKSFVVERLFRVEIACAREGCASRMAVLVPASAYTSIDWIPILAAKWRPTELVFACGHKVKSPVRIARFEQLY